MMQKGDRRGWKSLLPSFSQVSWPSILLSTRPFLPGASYRACCTRVMEPAARPPPPSVLTLPSEDHLAVRPPAPVSVTPPLSHSGFHIPIQISC